MIDTADTARQLTRRLGRFRGAVFDKVFDVMEILRLLGWRRCRRAGEQLVVTRRPYGHRADDSS